MPSTLGDVLLGTALAFAAASPASTSPRVTFIHPRGHEHGWREVERNIYGFFGSTFSKRSLKRVGDLHVEI